MLISFSIDTDKTCHKKPIIENFMYLSKKLYIKKVINEQSTQHQQQFNAVGHLITKTT